MFSYSNAMLTRRSYVTQVKHKIQVTRVKRNER